MDDLRAQLRDLLPPGSDLEEPLTADEACLDNTIKHESDAFDSLSRYADAGDYAPLAVGQNPRMVRNSSQDALHTMVDNFRHSSASLQEQQEFEAQAKRVAAQIAEQDYNSSWLDTLPHSSKRTIGAILAAVSGIFYG